MKWLNQRLEPALIGLYQVNADYKSGSICGTGCEKTPGATGIDGNFGAILAGFSHTISGSYSSILGGEYNTVLGNYSAILGGSGNTVPVGCNFVGIFGNSITAVADNTFHVNCLNACGSPSGPGLLPPGTLYYIPTTACMAAIGFPFPGKVAMLA